MSESTKNISTFAQRFVTRKFAEFRKRAMRDGGLQYELYAQSFTDRVGTLMKNAKRADLREYIDTQARKADDYVKPEEGRWHYDRDVDHCVFVDAQARAMEPSVQQITPDANSPQARFEALVSKLRMPGLKKEAPAPAKRGRPMDR